MHKYLETTASYLLAVPCPGSSHWTPERWSIRGPTSELPHKHWGSSAMRLSAKIPFETLVVDLLNWLCDCWLWNRNQQLQLRKCLKMLKNAGWFNESLMSPTWSSSNSCIYPSIRKRYQAIRMQDLAVEEEWPLLDMSEPFSDSARKSSKESFKVQL